VKRVEHWYSERLQQYVKVARWGEFGRPVLLFPTAGGDAEESERFGLIGAAEELLAAGRIKIYSVDSVAGRAWAERHGSGRHRAWVQSMFDAFVYHEVVPAIRADCHDPNIDIITAGASIGAFNAVASLCRHPDVFRAAIAMSGTFDLERWLDGDFCDDFYFSSPLHFVPGLEGEALWQLQQRFVLLPFGQGRWEAPGETWRLADCLGAKGVPNRVVPWGHEHDHDWPTWRAMLPLYLDELTR
jgi:esterase/lipase superfamily enzyme